MSFDPILVVRGDSGVGTANTTQAVPSHLQASDSGIKIWTGSAWATLANGTNNNTLSALQTANWGLEAEAAYQRRLRDSSSTINIFKYWAGSLKLAAYLPGGSMYATLVSQMAAARAALSNPVIIADYCWMGWSDGNSSNDANIVQANYESFVTNAKKDLGYTDATRYVVGLVEVVAGWTQPPLISTVRTAQAAFCAVDPNNRKTVETSAYSFQADNNGHPSATGNVSAGIDFDAADVSCKRWGARWAT